MHEPIGHARSWLEHQHELAHFRARRRRTLRPLGGGGLPQRRLDGREPGAARAPPRAPRRAPKSVEVHCARPCRGRRSGARRRRGAACAQSALYGLVAARACRSPIPPSRRRRRPAPRCIFPGNLYNYGSPLPPVIDETTPMRPTSRKGQLRVAIEERMAEAAERGARTIVLRAGDFFGGGRGAWLDLVIAKEIGRGRAHLSGTARRWCTNGPTCPIWRRRWCGSPPFARRSDASRLSAFPAMR